jgi:hypothetical protein
MNSIKRYRKITDDHTTHQVHYGSLDDDNEPIVELATLDDGYTYISVPDGATISSSSDLVEVEDVELTPVLRKQIRKASPHVALIKQRINERIRERYSESDEFQMLRTGPTTESSAYNDYVESVLEWGRDQRRELGL